MLLLFLFQCKFPLTDDYATSKRLKHQNCPGEKLIFIYYHPAYYDFFHFFFIIPLFIMIFFSVILYYTFC